MYCMQGANLGICTTQFVAWCASEESGHLHVGFKRQVGLLCVEGLILHKLAPRFHA